MPAHDLFAGTDASPPSDTEVTSSRHGPIRARAREQALCRGLAANSPDLRIELTCDDEPLTYCRECWERKFGES